MEVRRINIHPVNGSDVIHPWRCLGCTSLLAIVKKFEGRIIHALQLCDPHFNPSVHHPAGFCIIKCKGTIRAEANGNEAILSNTFTNNIFLAGLYPLIKKGNG